MALNREDQVYMAKLAEQAERYDEMATFMRDAAKLDVQFSAEERNLLSVAYKNVIEARRDSCRKISSIEQKGDDTEGDEHHPEKIKEYRSKIEAELVEVCTEILAVLDEHLIRSAQTGEAKAYYHKMKGDYHHYLVEFASEDGRTAASGLAEKSYNEATTIASKLSETHPIRLGLALNLSVFYYEVLNSPERACDLAKKAFDLAIENIDDLKEESYQDSARLMLHLRENLTFWTSKLPDAKAKEDEAAAAAPNDAASNDAAPSDAASEAAKPEVIDA